MTELYSRHPLVRERHNRLRKKIREFAENEIKPVAIELDRKGKFSQRMTKRLGEMGLFGITLPEGVFISSDLQVTFQRQGNILLNQVSAS